MKQGEDAEKVEGVEKLFHPSFAEACKEQHAHPLWVGFGLLVVYTRGLSSGALSGLQGRSFCTRIVFHEPATRKYQQS